jgi:hypothetical protein
MTRSEARKGIATARKHLESGALEEHLTVKGMVCYQALLKAAEELALPERDIFGQSREDALDMVEMAREFEVQGALDDFPLDDVARLIEAAETLARPLPRESRWVVLPFTSNSGKTLFRCGVCGRLSNTPDKGCPDKWPCEEFTGEPGIMNPAPEGFK